MQAALYNFTTPPPIPMDIASRRPCRSTTQTVVNPFSTPGTLRSSAISYGRILKPEKSRQNCVFYRLSQLCFLHDFTCFRRIVLQNRALPSQTTRHPLVRGFSSRESFEVLAVLSLPDQKNRKRLSGMHGRFSGEFAFIPRLPTRPAHIQLPLCTMPRCKPGDGVLHSLVVNVPAHGRRSNIKALCSLQ